eukprot:scaffold2708_cov158-Ochromonas_danica.AAC.35
MATCRCSPWPLPPPHPSLCVLIKFNRVPLRRWSAAALASATTPRVAVGVFKASSRATAMADPVRQATAPSRALLLPHPLMLWYLPDDFLVSCKLQKRIVVMFLVKSVSSL